jgi:hypothetical protein
LQQLDGQGAAATGSALAVARLHIRYASLMINPLSDFQSSGVKYIRGISGRAAFFSHKTMDNRFQTPEE